MDKFTKYALLTMALIVTIMLISTYVGSVIFKGNMEGTDANVNNSASSGKSSWFGFGFTADAFGQMGEYVGFSTAGAIGGLIVGYSYPVLFPKKDNVSSKGKKNNA